jgi:hypothetical protein
MGLSRLSLNALPGRRREELPAVRFCDRFPLNKAGSIRGFGIVWPGRKVERCDAALGDTTFPCEDFRGSQDNPRATGVAAPPASPAFAKGKMLLNALTR